MFKRGLILFLTLAVLLLGVCSTAFAEQPNKGESKKSMGEAYTVQAAKQLTKVEKYTTVNVENSVVNNLSGVLNNKQKNNKNKFKFKDVGNHWAAPQISAVYIQGIISGYPDYTFQPEKPVTRNEALLMLCRATGFEDDDYTGEKKWNDVPDWMRACMAFAVEKGIISPEEAAYFKGQTPAKRYEVAVWAARAADLGADSNINFVDLKDIPSFAIPYIGSMYRCNYMVGYPDNLFQPNKPIKRAEICTLLFNMLPDFTNSTSYKIVRGTVDSVDSDTVTVRNREYEMSDDVEIFVNKKSAGLEDIEEGFSVVLFLNSEQEVLYLFAVQDDEDTVEEEAPEVKSFTPGDGEENVAQDTSKLKVEFNQYIQAADSLEDVAGKIDIDADARNEGTSITNNVYAESVKISGRTLTVYLSDELDYNTEYTVTIDEGAIESEASGKTNEEIDWSFSAESGEELTVISLYPKRNAENVDQDLDELKVTFNQSVKAHYSNDELEDAITISDDIDVESVDIDDDKLIIYLDENDSLDYDETYIVTVAGGVIEAKDGGLTNDTIRWEFTVEEEED